MDLAGEELRRMKIDAHAPCVYYEYTGQSNLKRAPSINCSPGEACKTCGFNPAEQRRRLLDGKMKPKRTRMAWIEDKHFANGGTVKEIECPPGTMQLVFPAENEGEVSE